MKNKIIINVLALVVIIAVSFSSGMLLSKKTLTNEEIGTFELTDYTEQIEKFSSEYCWEMPLSNSHTVKEFAVIDFSLRLDVKVKNLKVSYDDGNDTWYVCADVCNKRRSASTAHIFYRAQDAKILAIWCQ